MAPPREWRPPAAQHEPRDLRTERVFLAALLFGMACGAVAAGVAALRLAEACMR